MGKGNEPGGRVQWVRVVGLREGDRGQDDAGIGTSGYLNFCPGLSSSTHLAGDLDSLVLVQPGGLKVHHNQAAAEDGLA